MKQYRQNGPIHRAWTLYPTVRGGVAGVGFKLLTPRIFRYLPAGTSETFGPTTLVYKWNSDAATSIAAGQGVMFLTVTPYVIFTILGSGAFFFIEEDLHDITLDTGGGPDFCDLFWIINGRVEDRQA